MSNEHYTKVLEVRKVVEPILSFLPRSIPHFTDHGIRHSNNLLRLLIRYINNFTSIELREEEKFLLALAIHIHDVGCIIGRSKHGKKSKKLIQEHPSFCLLKEIVEPDLLNCLALIISAHTNDFDLQKIKAAPFNVNVRHKFVCTLFRLLDACEITSARISPTLYSILRSYNKIKLSSIKHWESSLSIGSLVFSGNDIVIRYSNRRKASLQTKHLKEDLKKINLSFKTDNFPELNITLVKD